MRVFAASFLRSCKLLVLAGISLLVASSLLASYRAPTDAGPLPYPITYYPEKSSMGMDFFTFMLRHVLQPAKKGVREFDSRKIFRRADLLATKPTINRDLATLSVAQVLSRHDWVLTGTPEGKQAQQQIMSLLKN